MVRTTLMPLAVSLMLPPVGRVIGQGPNGGTTGPAEDVMACARSISQRFQVPVLVDPAIVPPRHVSRSPVGSSAASALDRLTLDAGGSKWARVRIPTASAVEGAAERVSAAVRVLVSAGSEALAVSDHKDGTVRLLNVARRAAADSETAFVVYSTQEPSDGMTRSERFERRQRAMMELMDRLPAARRSNPMLGWAAHFQSLSAAAAKGAMERIGGAGSDQWGSTDKETRELLMKQSMTVMQTYGAEGAGAEEPINPEPASLATSKLAQLLKQKLGVELLAEPEVQIVAASDTVLARDRVEDVMADITKADPELEWRLVHTNMPLSSAVERQRLVDSVRSLSHLGVPALVLEAPGRQIAFAIQTDSRRTTDRPAPTDLPEKELYLLYLRQPGSANPAAAFAQLQKDQMETLAKMPKEALAQTMASAIEQFRTADAVTQAKMAGMPLFAGMMASWFPQAPKEKGGGQ